MDNHLMASILEQMTEQPGALDSHVIAAGASMAVTEIRRLEAENAVLREALLLAIRLGLDLGLTEMEVDSVLMRAGVDSLAALARQTKGEG